MRTATLFGCLIGLILLTLQLVPFLMFRSPSVDWLPALAGVAFLFAGLFIGSRRSSSTGEIKLSVRGMHRVPGDAAGLTPRETDMLMELATGKTNAEIAVDQFVSVNTVKTHVSNICGKLGVSRRGQAVARARELGIIE